MNFDYINWGLLIWIENFTVWATVAVSVRHLAAICFPQTSDKLVARMCNPVRP